MIFDLVIIGGGPAGAACGIKALQKGLNVLIIERGSFPRQKVCGCCLSPRGVSYLIDQLRIDKRDLHRHSHPLKRIEAVSSAGTIRIPVKQGGRVISREVLDTKLHEVFVSRGGKVLYETTISKGDLKREKGHFVIITQKSKNLQAKSVVWAMGLKGSTSSKDNSGIRYIGCGTIVNNTIGLPEGVLKMYSHQFGYAGFVALKGGHLDIAAAVEQNLVKKARGVDKALERMFSDFPDSSFLQLRASHWKTTAVFPAGYKGCPEEGQFPIGDLFSYAEPISGEGMAWAMESGMNVVPYIIKYLQSGEKSVNENWLRAERQRAKKRELRSRLLGKVAHTASRSKKIIGLLQRFPSFSSEVFGLLSSRSGRIL